MRWALSNELFATVGPTQATPMTTIVPVYTAGPPLARMTPVLPDM